MDAYQLAGRLLGFGGGQGVAERRIGCHAHHKLEGGLGDLLEDVPGVVSMLQNTT